MLILFDAHPYHNISVTSPGIQVWTPGEAPPPDPWFARATAMLIHSSDDRVADGLASTRACEFGLPIIVFGNDLEAVYEWADKLQRAHGPAAEVYRSNTPFIKSRIAASVDGVDWHRLVPSASEDGLAAMTALWKAFIMWEAEGTHNPLDSKAIDRATTQDGEMVANLVSRITSLTQKYPPIELWKEDLRDMCQLSEHLRQVQFLWWEWVRHKPRDD